MVEAKVKKDWVTPAVVALGAGGIAIGLYLALKKPPGVSPGDAFVARFKFEYLGVSAAYVIQIRFGNHNRILGVDWFIDEGGLIWYKEVNLPGPDFYELDLRGTIPDGAPARTYDVEGVIRTPAMSTEDRLIRVFVDKGIVVR